MLAALSGDRAGVVLKSCSYVANDRSLMEIRVTYFIADKNWSYTIFRRGKTNTGLYGSICHQSIHLMLLIKFTYCEVPIKAIYRIYSH